LVHPESFALPPTLPGEFMLGQMNDALPADLTPTELAAELKRHIWF
jgi:hypothetical protein